MYRIRFDAFIRGVITSEPTIKEPVSIMQRFDFDNGYGDELLVTHLRILGRTFVSESKHNKITLKAFQAMAKTYSTICDNDVELAYSIINSKKCTYLATHIENVF